MYVVQWSMLGKSRTLVNSLVVSKIDYCNCLLAGMPANLTDKLQSVMNAAAKIVCGLKKYDHITSHMRDSLHWLRIPQRVTFKLCLRTYKFLHGCAPDYLIGTLHFGCTIGTEVPLVISCSRWSDHPENNNIVWRPWAFAHAGPQAWNSLPPLIRAAKTLPVFKKLLKTKLWTVKMTHFVTQSSEIFLYFYHLCCELPLWQFFSVYNNL